METLNKHVNAHLAALDQIMDSLENAPRPWYFTASTIYAYVKARLNHASVESITSTIDKLVLAINNKVIHVTLEENFSFSGLMDTLIQNVLSSTDIFVDASRVTIVGSLRKLTSVILNNAVVKSVTQGSLVKTLSSTFDNTLAGIVEIVDTRGKICMCSRFDIFYSPLVVAARPTVQKYVSIAQPYVETALEVSQPLIDRASPYVERTKKVLEENSYTGPFVSPIVETAGSVLTEVKAYCIAPTPDSAGTYPKIHSAEEEETNSFLSQ